MTRPGPSLTVLFDLDGTLVDSREDIVRSFVHALVTNGHGAPPHDLVAALVGRPLGEMFEEFAPPTATPELVRAYREHYAKHLAVTTRPFPGVVAALGELAGLGFMRAVATTKPSGTALAVVEAVGLRPSLEHVQGTDGFAPKPAPDVIERALAAVGRAGVVMVGDTPADVLAGRAAGLATYGVSWGTSTAEELRGAGADLVAPDLGQLVGFVARHAEG